MTLFAGFCSGSLRWVPGLSLAALLAAAAVGVAAPTATITNFVTTAPGVASVTIGGLNAAGQVAGYWTESQGRQRAFLSQKNVLFDLGTLGGAVGVGVALNNAGRVVGYSSRADEAVIHAFLHQEGTMKDLGGIGGNSAAVAIGDADHVTGYAYVSPTAFNYHAFLYSAGTIRDLGTLGGAFSSGLAVNRLGYVAGESTTLQGQTHAFLYRGGAMSDLGTFGGTYSSPNALNNLGQVTGAAATPDELLHAFWFNGRDLVDLGTLGGNYSEGFALNDLGQVAGDATLPGEDQYHGFLYADGRMQDLGTLGGDSSSVWAMNNQGQIIGTSLTAAGLRHAVVWHNGRILDLNSLLPADSGWELEFANYINDAGQIVGTGTYLGQPAWFLLTLPALNNQSPVARAGADQIVECAGDRTPALLDGSTSTDPDGDPLSFEWFLDRNLLGTAAKLQVNLACGSHLFTLRVTDKSGSSSEDTVQVTVSDTMPPLVTCPGSVKVAADADGRAPAPDLLPRLSVGDACTPAPMLVKSQVPAAETMLPLGAHPVTITVVDAAGNRATCATVIQVIDATPPVIAAVTADPPQISPLNHQMVPVTINVLASDNCGAAPSCRVVSVTSSDPPDGTLAWRITGALTLELRAESSVKDVPRIYTVTVACTDAAGNVSTASVVVVTQRNNKKTGEPILLRAGPKRVAGIVAKLPPARSK